MKICNISRTDTHFIAMHIRAM